MNEKKLSTLQHMVQLNSSQPRSFIKKLSNSKNKSVVCECLLLLVNSILPVSFPNPNYFGESYKTLIKK